MRNFKVSVGAAMAVALAAIAGAGSASARVFVVYDTMTEYDSSNNVIASVVVTQAQQAVDPMAISYLGGVAVDTVQAGNYGMVTAYGHPIDIFGLAGGNPGGTGPDDLYLAFAAGPGTAGYSIQNPVVDTGAPIDVTQYLAPELRDAGDTAFFTASGNFTEDVVPEPTTWALMLVGVGGLGVTLRARRRATFAA